MKLPKMNKAQRRLFDDIKAHCARYNRYHASKPGKTVAAETQHSRFKHLVSALVVDLHAAGRHRTRLKNLKPGDIIALIQYWEPRIGYRTLRNRISTLRGVCRQLNKPDIMPVDVRDHLEFPERYRTSEIARQEQTPSAQGMDVGAFLAKVFGHDVLLGLVQLFKFEWGLRRREALMIRPEEQDKGDWLLIKGKRGPKSGRVRAITHYDFKAHMDDDGSVVVVDPELDPIKRTILDLAKQFTNSRGSLIPDGYSLSRWMRWERTVVEEYCGCSIKELETTSHKFRHEYAQHRVELVSELERVFRREERKLSREEIRREHLARRLATEELGHRDKATMNFYAGQAPERAPRGFVAKLEAALSGGLGEPIIRKDRNGRIVGGSGRRIRVEYSNSREANVVNSD